MAFEVTKQEILKQAAEFKRLYDQTRDKKYKDQETRLRRIVVELDNAASTGVTTLDGLSDVTISAPANAQVLTYNSTTSQWENQTPGGGGGGDMTKSVYDVDNDGIVDGSETTQIIVRNSTGVTLTKGQVVYLSGATGNRPNAVLSQANTEATSSKTIGIVIANIANNSDGYIAVNGTLHNLDTSAFTAGDAVWLSATTAGAYTSTIPSEPNHTVFIGYIARSHPTQGRLVIAIQNGYELNELHGVLISSEANNDLLVYETSTTLWKNKSISTIFGGTPLVSVPTLAQVTTAGNTTTNAITVGGLTSTSNGLIASASGNINTVPLGVLHVRGENGGSGAAWGGITVSSRGSSNGVYRLRLNGNDTTGAGEIGVPYGNPLILQGGGTYFGNAAESGNVLIGTTTDAGYRLQVSGKQLITSTGNTSATESFKILNSSGSIMLQVSDNGNIGVNGAALTSTAYRLRVYGGIWADAIEQLMSLNGSSGVGKIEYYNTGGSHRTIGLRTYGSHAFESVKGFVEISSQVLTYTGIGNIVLHADVDFLDHPTLIIRSLNTTQNSFYMQNYHHSQGALFITKADTGGDNSMRFRPGRTSDVMVISTSGITVTGTIVKQGGTSSQFLKADGSVDSTVYYAAANPSGYTTNVGTVTSIVAGTGLSGGTITTSGTIALANTAVTAGAYTNANITVDAQGRITLAANGSAGTPSQWTTTGSDIYYNTGNVGIGTASPTDILHIVSGAAANIFGRISSTNANGTAAWVAQNDQTDNVVYRVFGSGASGTQMGIALARTASLIANLGGSGSFLLGTYSATNFIMGTGNAEKMRIVDSTGNILIATTTDLGNKLEVSGTINSTGYKINNTAGYTGILNIVTNPPGMQNIDIQSGIIVNVF